MSTDSASSIDQCMEDVEVQAAYSKPMLNTFKQMFILHVMAQWGDHTAISQPSDVLHLS